MLDLHPFLQERHGSKPGYTAGAAGSPRAVSAAEELQESSLPVAPLGNSDDILVGEWAIGNPFDLGPTVSVGLVRAVDRDF